MAFVRAHGKRICGFEISIGVVALGPDVVSGYTTRL